MNRFLFYCSFVYGVFLLLLLLLCKSSSIGILEVLIIVGIATSIWNHGCTNHMALLCDRLVMVVGFIILFRLLDSHYIPLLLVTACLYVGSKVFSNDLLHFIGMLMCVFLLSMLIMNKD